LQQNKYKIISFDPTVDISDTVTMLRDAALAIEGDNIKLANDLMRQALVFCPADPELKKKADEYERQLLAQENDLPEAPTRYWLSSLKRRLLP